MATTTSWYDLIRSALDQDPQIGMTVTRRGFTARPKIDHPAVIGPAEATVLEPKMSSPALSPTTQRCAPAKGTGDGL